MNMEQINAQQIRRFACVVILGLSAISAAKAEDGSYAQRVACTPDAWRLCSDAIPDVDAVKACMVAKKSQLSRACQATFPRRTATR